METKGNKIGNKIVSIRALIGDEPKNGNKQRGPQETRKAERTPFSFPVKQDAAQH
jgi:hypothetical protein